jgi:hypothetical protein
MSRIAFKNNITDISVNTPESMLTIDIPYVKQRKKLITFGITPRATSGLVTGTLEVQVKWLESSVFTTHSVVDLGDVTQNSISNLTGEYKQIRLVHTNLVGSFDFAIIGY